MTLLLGIDEAGYGPILGPLVVSGAALELPDEHLADDLWDLLRPSVTRTAKGSSGRLVINDSKALHKKNAKTDHLQRGVLAALYAQCDSLPQTVGQLLTLLDVPDPDQLDQYPWYGSALSDMAISADPDDIRTAGAHFRADCRARRITVHRLLCRPLPVGAYNRAVSQTRNKATVLFNTACQIIYRLWSQNPNHTLQVVLDKQGGRSHYRQHLQRMFPELAMKILKETDTVSSYQLSAAHRCLKVHFLQKGDRKHLLIALASMISKYVREQFMAALNRHFTRMAPQLKPTAGYYQDGTRFLNDLRRAGLLDHQPGHLLIRDK